MGHILFFGCESLQWKFGSTLKVAALLEGEDPDWSQISDRLEQVSFHDEFGAIDVALNSA